MIIRSLEESVRLRRRGAASFPGDRRAAGEGPAGELSESSTVVHDVLADEEAGYTPSVVLREVADAGEVGLRIRMRDADAVVARKPLWVSYPRAGLRAGRHLFTVAPGQVGRHQFNLRDTYTACSCAPFWIYEHWVLHVANVRSPVAPDLFLDARPAFDSDDRTHLYGGTTRRARLPSSGRKHRT